MKADVKSSGNAAPMAQPRPPGELGVSLALQFSDDLLFGANNFMLMLKRVYEISDQTVFRYGDGDGRDYPLMCFEIETAILANLLGSGKQVREGFLRAMADYLSHIEDGGHPDDSWDGRAALTTTAAAFANRNALEVSHG